MKKSKIIHNLFYTFDTVPQMFFHGKDRKSLLKHINAANLPANYGGDLPMLDYSSKDWYETLNSHADFIARWNAFGLANSN